VYETAKYPFFFVHPPILQLHCVSQNVVFCISLTYGNLNASLDFDCFSATVSMPVMDVSSGCNSSKPQVHVQLIFGIFHMLKWKILVLGNFFFF